MEYEPAVQHKAHTPGILDGLQGKYTGFKKGSRTVKKGRRLGEPAVQDEARA